jgi:hypothetical protein
MCLDYGFFIVEYLILIWIKIDDANCANEEKIKSK